MWWAGTVDGPCTMEQFRDGRSIPPGYVVPGGKDEEKKKGKNDENLAKTMEHWRILKKKGMGMMDKNDEKSGKMRKT